MIEIIIGHVEMPQIKHRRFQYMVENDKWWVIDTSDKNKIVYKGGFENVMLACHNLNKKHYQELNQHSNK